MVLVVRCVVLAVLLFVFCIGALDEVSNLQLRLQNAKLDLEKRLFWKRLLLKKFPDEKHFIDFIFTVFLAFPNNPKLHRDELSGVPKINVKNKELLSEYCVGISLMARSLLLKKYITDKHYKYLDALMFPEKFVEAVYELQAFNLSEKLLRAGLASCTGLLKVSYSTLMSEADAYPEIFAWLIYKLEFLKDAYKVSKSLMTILETNYPDNASWFYFFAKARLLKFMGKYREATAILANILRKRLLMEVVVEFAEVLASQGKKNEFEIFVKRNMGKIGYFYLPKIAYLANKLGLKKFARNQMKVFKGLKNPYVYLLRADYSRTDAERFEWLAKTLEFGDKWLLEAAKYSTAETDLKALRRFYKVAMNYPEVAEYMRKLEKRRPEFVCLVNVLVGRDKDAIRIAFSNRTEKVYRVLIKYLDPAEFDVKKRIKFLSEVDDQWAKVELGKIYLEMGNFNKAKELFEKTSYSEGLEKLDKLLKQKREKFRSLYNEAKRLLSKGEFGKFKSLLEELKREYCSDSMIKCEASIEVLLKMKKNAEGKFNKLKRVFFKHFEEDGLKNYYDVTRKEKRLLESVKKLKEIFLKIAGAVVIFSIVLPFAYIKLKAAVIKKKLKNLERSDVEWSELERVAEEALKYVDPESEEYLKLLAEAKINNGKFSEGILLLEVLYLKSLEYVYLEKLIKVLFKLKNYARALEILKHVWVNSTVPPEKEEEFLKWLKEAALAEEDIGVLEKVYDRLVELDVELSSDDIETMINVYRVRKRYEDAMKWVTKLMKLYPSNPRWRVEFIKLLILDDKIDVALDEIEKFIEDFPTERKLARELLGQVFDKEPHNPKARKLAVIIASIE